MNRTQARDKLTEIGFSKHDAERMVTTNAIDRAVGGEIASGLTDDAEIGVFYRSGRYTVMTRHRHEDPAPCMWHNGHWAEPWAEA